MNTNNSSSSKSGSKSAKMRTMVIKLSRKLSIVFTWRPGGRISRLLTSLLAICAAPALALPTGGQVVSGNVTIQSPSGTSMTVTQSSNKGIVNWNGFSIAPGEAVNYVQPSASSVTLNRVLGNDPSAIFGSLSANGQVFLINPNGVMFAPGAQVNVGGLVASTLGLSDANFLAGQYTFENGNGAGAIDNQGGLNGKYIALIAPNISNSGSINTNGGTTALAAGDRVSLDISGDGLLAVSVDAAATNASIKHSGSITADGGQVFISAHSANALLDTVLNVSGVVRAHSVSEQNGVIVLDGGNAGVVSVTGSLDASGTGAGQSGGTVKVLGDKVGLFAGASIDVSGDAGGGTALIGGNFHGAGPEANASMTYVAQGAAINADAVTSGNGGNVAVWSNDATRYYGNITARGGALGGDGGFVETSGHWLDVAGGRVDTRASNGAVGSWLLDPYSINIGPSGSTDATPDFGNPDIWTGVGAVSVLLDADLSLDLQFSDVIVRTDWAHGGATGAGDINVLTGSSIIIPAGTTLTLDAFRNVTIQGNASITGADNTGVLQLNVGQGSNGGGGGSGGLLTIESGVILPDGATTGTINVAAVTGGSIDVTRNAGMTLTDATLVVTGAYTLNLTHITTASLTGGVSANAIDASGFTGNVSVYATAGADTVTGNGTNTTLVGMDATSDWAITGTAGTYTQGVNVTTIVSGVTTLQGGSAVDTFTLSANATANIKGGDGLDVLALATHTLTGSYAGEAAGGTITGIGSATLTATGTTTGFNGTSDNVSAGFTDVTSLTGTGTLTGLDAVSGWAMSGTGGTYTSTNALTYSGFATLQGGTAIDTYTLSANATANIKGGDGLDVLALATHTLTGSYAGEAAGGTITGIGSATLTATGTTTGFNGTSDNVSAGFTDVTSLTGTGTLTGLDAVSGWAMSGTGGTYTSTYALTYSGFATLQGGTGADTFNVVAATTANLLGGTGSNTLDYSGYSHDVTVSLTGANQGTATGTGGFTGIDTITGNAAQNNTMGGTGLTYTLDATTADKGSSQGVTWTAFKNISDTTGTVNFQTGGSVTGNVLAATLNESTDASTLVISLTGPNAGTATNIGGSFSGVSAINANAAKSNTVGGTGLTYLLDATTADKGSSQGLTWTAIKNVSDTTGTVNFNTGGSVTGNVLAATLNESTDAANLAVTLTGTNAGTATNIGGSFSGVSAINANAAKSNTMGGTGLTYTLDATTADKASSNGVTWTAFKNLSDATGTVNFSTGGSVTGNVLATTLNESAYNADLAVTLTGTGLGTATNIGGSFSGVSAINANAAKSNTMGGTGLTYTLDATTADKGSSQGVTWTAFKNLTDTGASTFIGGANAQISGALTANSGATLNGQIKAASASFGAVTLGSDVNLTTTGNAAFNSTIDGAYALSLNAGSTTLGGVIGGSNVLTGLTINTGGDLTLKPIHALMADLTAAGDILKGDAAGTPELYVRDSLKLNATNVGATTNLVLANLNIAGGIELGLVPTSTTLTVAPAGHAIFVVPDQPTFTALRASTSGKLYGGATNAQQALGCYTGNCSSLVDGSAQSLGGTTGAVILAAAQQEMLMSLSSTDNLGAAIYNAWVTTIGVVPPGLDNIVGDGVNSQMEMLQTLPLPQSLLYVPQPQSLLYVPQQQSPLYD